MNRRSFLFNSALTVGAIGICQQKILSAFLQEPWKITMLRNDIGIFTEKGGTIAFLLGKKGIVVVDAQFPEQSQHLIDELKKKSEAGFELLINTHHHGDHSSGNISYKGLVKHVLAHENSKSNQERVAKQNNADDKQLYPDQTYSVNWCEKIAGEKICLSYFGAGHTNGDSFVHFQNANIVHCGDLVFNRRHPYVDRSSGANMKSWMKVLDKAISKFDNNTQYVFGHAGTGYDVTGKAEDLAQFRDYLGNVLHFVEAEIKAGKTKEEILKNAIIAGSAEWKGDGIQRPLTAAWEELNEK